MKLFDFDGTLMDSNGVWDEVDAGFLSRYGLKATREYVDTVGHSIFPIAAQFTKDYYGLDLSAEEIMAQWLELAWDAYAHRVTFKEGAEAFLRRCREAGEPMALVTACVPELCRAAMARHGLEDWFTGVVFVQELGLEKRDPQAFLQAAARLGVSPAACTVYDDSPAACAAAREAGMAVVGVYDPLYAHAGAEMRRICHRYITGFPELLEEPKIWSCTGRPT